MDLARPSPDRRALLRAELPSETLRDVKRAARRRAALLRDDLPSDPDEQARTNRPLYRDVGGVTGGYDFWEPRNWRIVGRPSLWRRVRAWWGR